MATGAEIAAVTAAALAVKMMDGKGPQPLPVVSLSKKGSSISLLDPFRPPLSDDRNWHSFYNSWTTYLSSRINAQLPEGYFAEANVRYGIEIDVAAFAESNGQNGAANIDWALMPPDESLPMVLTEAVVEVGIFSR